MKPKSAEEWRGYIATAVSGIVSLDDVVKRVQLDAWNAAIRTAADSADTYAKEKTGTDSSCLVIGAIDCRDRILSHLTSPAGGVTSAPAFRPAAGVRD